MQKYLIVLGLAASITANAAVTFQINGLASLSSTGSNIAIDNAPASTANTAAKIDFIFTPNAAISGTTFTLTPDTTNDPGPSFWSPNPASYEIFQLGTLKLDTNESVLANTPNCGSSCGNIVASIGLSATGQYAHNFGTVSTPQNSSVARGTFDPPGSTPAFAYFTITPDGATLNYAGNQAKTPQDYAFNGAAIHIWLYTSQSTGSWNAFNLDTTSFSNGNYDQESDSQTLWMKVWLTGTPTPSVPEPASLGLAGAGLLALGYTARRRGLKQ